MSVMSCTVSSYHKHYPDQKQLQKERKTPKTKIRKAEVNGEIFDEVIEKEYAQRF